MKILTSHIRIRLLCLAALLALTSCQTETRRPIRYLIPQGYVGWVRIEFGIPHASALPVEDDSYLIRFTSEGYIQTSSPIEYGAASDDYYYYSENGREPLPSTGWGKGGMIWGRSNGLRVGAEDRPYEHLFIGTEEQFKTIGANMMRGEDGRPIVGATQVSELRETSMK